MDRQDFAKTLIGGMAAPQRAAKRQPQLSRGRPKGSSVLLTRPIAYCARHCNSHFDLGLQLSGK